MIATPERITRSMEVWLEDFERALRAGDDAVLQTLFHPQSYWRDVLAFTWDIVTLEGAPAILTGLKAHVQRVQPFAFKSEARSRWPRQVARAGVESAEGFFTFETAIGRCQGVLRLLPDADDEGAMKAWTLLTTLEEIKGHEER